MRRLLLLSFLLAAPAVRAAPDAPPAASPELASLVPAETLFLAECNDLDGKGRFGPDTGIGKLLAEPQVRYFLKKLGASFWEAYQGNARRPLAMVGLAPEDFTGISFRRAGVALVDVSLAPHQVDAVLYLDVRTGADKVERILRGLRQAAEMFTQTQFKEEEVGAWKLVSTDVLGHELCVATQGDRFLLTTRRARMDQVLKATDGGLAASLAASPRASRLRERMGAQKNTIFAYADVPALARLGLEALQRHGRADPTEVNRIATALGLDAVEAVGFADVPEGAGYRTEGAILLKERRGIFALASKTPPSHTFAWMTPPDALAFSEATCDLAQLWDGILGIAGAIDPDARAKLERGVREGGAVVGLDLRKDLLEAFGTEWGGYVAWPPGGGILPDVVLFASVRDRARLEKTLDALADKLREFRGRGATVTPGRTEFEGKEIRFLEITDKRGEPRPYTPAWAFGDDFLVFGLCPQTVKHALMQKDPGLGAPLGARGLLSSSDFQRLLAAAPKGSVKVTYVDLGRAVTWLYAAGVPFLQVAQSALNRRGAMPGFPGATALLSAIWGMRLNFEDLPTADVIARHLSGLLLYTAVEDDCIRVGYVSDVGAPLAIVPVAMAAALGVTMARVHVEKAEVARAQVKAMEEAQRAAEGGRARDAEQEKELKQLREENAMLRGRLDRLEARVAELLRKIEEGNK
jgi:hypothetical protein